VSAREAWAVGANVTAGATFARTLAEHRDGSGWSTAPTPNVGTYANFLNGVAAVASNNVWAVGTYVHHFVVGPTTYDIDQTLIEHWDGSTWSLQASPDQLGSGLEVSNDLTGITAIAANDVWAVGSYFNPGIPARQPLMLHYDGTSWSIVTSPSFSPNDDELFTVTGTAANDVWAGGFQTGASAGSPTQTLIEHWDGTAWTVSPSANGSAIGDNELFSMAALATNDVWAVGSQRPGVATGLRQTLAEHWNGTAWTVANTSNAGLGDNALFGVNAIASGNVWATGFSRADTSNSFRQTLTEHWNGTTWTTVASPNSGSGNNVLYGLAALSASDLWAVGYSTAGSGLQTLTENFCVPPTVTGVAPAAGPTSGGTTVTITGTNFVNAIGVSFGSMFARSFTIDSDTQITSVSPPQRSGTLHVQVFFPGGVTNISSADQFTFVPLYVFSPQPIAVSGSLAANTNVNVTLSAKNFDGTGVSGATVYLSFVQTGGSETAKVGATLLNASPTAFPADGNGNIAITFSTGPSPKSIGTDTITAQDASSPTVTAQDTYTYSKSTTFYFAEGFTGTGFTESLSLLMPTTNGMANIDYYTEAGHQPTVFVLLTAGQVHVEDVNADVGAGHQVSAVVSLSGPGVVERALHFNNGTWHGSTDKVGVNRTAQEWDFAEGSTLSIFAEFLSIENPNPYAVVVDLNYQTDISVIATRTLTVPANTRVTVVVSAGSVTPPVVTDCDPLATCGVGSGITGVSVQVRSRSLPIVAERPFYVMNYSFGYGPIKDGHDAFGANQTSLTWNFAEGTTLNGFHEYLTIQNPGSYPANVTIKYLYDLGTKTVNLVVPPQSRQTALVFDAAHFGVGRGYVGVSAQITSDQGIVAERPMYIYFNFGSGAVAGAHDVVGADSLQHVFGFAAASTAAGDNDYLTIQNPGSVDANITVDYYTTGGKVTKTFNVLANTRHTVLVFANNGEGVGPGFSPLGIVVSSDQMVLVEKPTYSSNSATYGATDTTGYTPPSGF
jgi:hypothetical protein